MSFWDHLLLYVVMTCQLVGPAPYLVWVWRRTGSWLALAARAIFIVPAASFVLGGGVLALPTAFRVFVVNAGLTGGDIGMTDWQYVRMTFVVCGIYGSMFSGMGMLLSLPLFAVWYAVHRKSFIRLTGHRGQRSADKAIAS